MRTLPVILAAFPLLFALACGDGDESETDTNSNTTETGTPGTTLPGNGSPSGSPVTGVPITQGDDDDTVAIGDVDSSTATTSTDGGALVTDAGTTTPPPPPPPTKSNGCGKAATPSTADGTPGSVSLSGTNRTFVTYIPKNYDPNRTYPVVFMYHGIGMKTSFMKIWIKMQDYSKGNAIVVFDDGNAAGTWDLSGEKDLLAFDAILASLNSSLCIDQNRVMALGFSMGAYMANHLACKRSSVVRGIVGAAGGMPDKTTACGGPVNALIYHKVDDDNENVANGRAARDKWLTLNGCKATPTTAFMSPLTCVQYQCSSRQTVYCEDAKHTPYNHDLDTDYRQPIWDQFLSKL